MQSRKFKAFVEGSEKELMVRSPSLNDQKEATKVYNQSFSEALKAKAVVRAKLDDLLVEQGLWDGAKQAKFTELQAKILDFRYTYPLPPIPLVCKRVYVRFTCLPVYQYQSPRL